MPYLCGLCGEQEPATVLMTPLTGGDTMAIGAECMVTGLCGMLAVAVNADPQKLYDALIGLAGKLDSDDAPASTPKRTRRPAAAKKGQDAAEAGKDSADAV